MVNMDEDLPSPDDEEMVRRLEQRLREPRTADVLQSSSVSTAAVTFEGLLLPEKILCGLRAAGFDRPSPIQLRAIPVGRCGFDMIVQAKSGTGKTVVFAVVALESIQVDLRKIQALVLGPTREIVVQISQVIMSLCAEMPAVKCHYFIGGTPVADDQLKLKKCHIAVGTPGRIMQLISQGFLKTDAIRLFVLDEADKLLDDKFQESINWIYRKLPASKQVLAASATYPESLAQLLTKYMQNPTFVRLDVQSQALIGVKQFYQITEFHPLFQKAYENKITPLMEILSSLPFGQCFIFSNYQLRAQGLCDRLRSSGWPTTFISGKQQQGERLKAIDSLKQFRCRILVSTDLTARGIDVENVDLVINLDVPWDADTYLHRIGRAGRYGTSGIAITLVAEGEEQKLLKEIQLKGKLTILPLPDRLNNTLWTMEHSEDTLAHSVIEGKDNSENGQILNEHGKVTLPPVDKDQAVVEESEKTENEHILCSLIENDNLKLETEGLQKTCHKMEENSSDSLGGDQVLSHVVHSQVVGRRSPIGSGIDLKHLSKATVLPWKPQFNYEKNKTLLETFCLYHKESDLEKWCESDEREVDDDDDDDDDDSDLMLAIDSIVLSSRIDCYKKAKSELMKLCKKRDDQTRFIGRCLRHLAAVTLPALDQEKYGPQDRAKETSPHECNDSDSESCSSHVPNAVIAEGSRSASSSVLHKKQPMEQEPMANGDVAQDDSAALSVVQDSWYDWLRMKKFQTKYTVYMKCMTSGRRRHFGWPSDN